MYIVRGIGAQITHLLPIFMFASHRNMALALCHLGSLTRRPGSLIRT
jgi:hypothetical protein